jgi:hypothetical protein
MKMLLVSILALLAFCRAPAQVSLELGLDQDQFLPNEAIRLAVKITNRSGQQLHLGADANWLTFSVESIDGFVVMKNSDVPVVDEFDLESSQMGTKHVDLQPYFQLGRPGRYKVTATMRIKEWSLAISSAPIQFDIINGGEVWSQDFGVAVGTNVPPESRRYTLLKANYLREQLRLYVRVSSNANVFKVAPLGPMVSFSSPEEEVDRFSQLHVLWQTGAQSFDYVVVGPDGALVSRDIYDNSGSRPRLMVNDSGDVKVRGGERRQNPAEAPVVKASESSAEPAAKP